MQNERQPRNLAIGLTVLSALGRLMPHPPNVTPLGGSCLFAGSKLSGLLAYLLPLVVMVATDPFVGGYTRSSPVIYACFLMNVWLGRTLLRKKTSPIRLGAVAFLCSLQFFVFTNFATWLSAVSNGSLIYQPTVAGLLECYAAALPFWGRTLAGDLVFSAAIFGMYALLTRHSQSEAVTA